MLSQEIGNQPKTIFIEPCQAFLYAYEITNIALFKITLFAFIQKFAAVSLQDISANIRNFCFKNIPNSNWKQTIQGKVKEEKMSLTKTVPTPPNHNYDIQNSELVFIIPKGQ